MHILNMKILPRFSLCLCLLGISHSFLKAEAAYYVISLDELNFGETEVAERTTPIRRYPRSNEEVVRYPGIETSVETAEAFIAGPEEDPNERNNWWRTDSQGALQVALHLPNNESVSGTVSLVQQSFPPIRIAREFQFDPADFPEATKEAYENVRAKHYARLAKSNIPGGDWFRHQAGDAFKLGSRRNGRERLGEFESSFNMFSGQRAVSENLALDRELILGTSPEDASFDISSIKGVTVDAIDWSARITNTPTTIDPLAQVIPHDQHAAFFDSIKSLNQIIQLVEKEGQNYFGSMANRDLYRGLANKYQKQMGLLLPDALAEQLPVKSVAITGGDPFLPSGSDLCLIFETDNPSLLLKSINALVAAQAMTHENVATPADSGAAQFAYSKADRSFSSYLYAGENYVAVANSPMQIQRLKRVAEGEHASLGSIEEFKFFRQRYRLDANATAFIFLSDATIRRWASPAFRIAASRRTRAAAVLGEATAELIGGAELTDRYEKLAGELSTQSTTVVQSEVFNTLGFLTPVSELEIEKVTLAEKQAYERWRRGYESGWVQFDPIALSLTISEDRLGADLSVIPLRLNSQYDEWIAFAGGATLDKEAVSPHPEALIMVSHAIDTSSETFQFANTQSSSMLPGLGANPLSWVGGSLSIFADQDPYWDEMNASEDPEDFVEENLGRLPVGLRVSNKSPMKLAMFLTTLRSFSEQAAPGLLIWETNKFEETPYVSIQPTRGSGIPSDWDLKIHYAALPEAFLLSLSEDVLKRAIARNLQSAASDTPEKESENSPHQIFAQTKVDALNAYLGLVEYDAKWKRTFASWAALPILNEWKRQFPEQDPVQVHFEYFKETIQCPGGKGYQWNEAIGSMESVAFGHPEALRENFEAIPWLENWDQAKAAISIKEREFRLEAELSR